MSILKVLQGKVVKFIVSEDQKVVRVREQCWESYTVALSKEGLGELIEELTAIHNEMVGGGNEH